MALCSTTTADVLGLRCGCLALGGCVCRPQWLGWLSVWPWCLALCPGLGPWPLLGGSWCFCGAAVAWVCPCVGSAFSSPPAAVSAFSGAGWFLHACCVGRRSVHMGRHFCQVLMHPAKLAEARILVLGGRQACFRFCEPRQGSALHACVRASCCAFGVAAWA